MERILQFREWPDKQIWKEMVVTAIVEFENAEFENRILISSFSEK